MDKKLIYQIPIPMRSRPDTWFWLLDNKGLFTVRSCYIFLTGESNSHERAVWTKLWKLRLPGKILNFLRRVLRGVLPTVVSLWNKH